MYSLKHLTFRILVEICLLAAIILLSSCKEDEPALPPTTLEGFSPSNGIVGTLVTITGTNFSTATGNNVVKFNNATAIVLSATASSLTATVPSGAMTGKISVTVDGKTATSATDFTVVYLPAITDFAPETGVIGTTVIITGSNFSSAIGDNVVKFNNVPAKITAAKATSLTVTVPEAATTGKITVEVGGQTATSMDDFILQPSLNGFIPAAGAIGSEVTITGGGFSAVAANNVVKFNNTAADIIAASVNSLTVMVPAGAATGLITVTIDTITLTSSTNYEVVVEAVKAGGAGYDVGYAVTVDASGNTYVTGSFDGTANFGSTALNAASEEIFVAKYNPAMDLEWAIQAGGSGSDRGTSISSDASGNIYITGTFGATATFGAYQLVPAGGSVDMFVAKFNAAGDVVWAKQAGSTSTNADAGTSVKADDAGNIYVTGNFWGAVIFGTTSLTANGSDVFIAKYDAATGDVIWAKNMGGSGDEYGLGITINADGYGYVTGTFSGTAEFGTTSFNAVAGFDAFIARYNTDGDIVWAKQIAGASISDNDLGHSVAVNNAGDCYVTGYFGGAVTFGTTTIEPIGASDIFVAKYEHSGNLLWAKKAGGSGYDNGLSIDVDATGYSYVTGFFSGTASFDDKSLVSAGGTNDIFVAQYNSSGVVQWAKKAGGLNHDSGNSIALDASRTIHVTGFFRDTTTFGTTPLTNASNDEIFLWKIRQ